MGDVQPTHPFPKEKQQETRRLYRAAVQFTDHNIGRVLASLDENNFTDSTIVVFTGDHGWLLGEHGVYCKQHNFELVARVPLVVHVPWLPQSHGKRTSAFVELVDMYQTTLDLANVTVRPPDAGVLEGHSFAPLLVNPTIPADQWKNATFTQYPRCSSSAGEPWVAPTNDACTEQHASTFAAMGYSIRSSRFRYTLWVKWNGDTLKPDYSQVVGEELYDHLGDTGMSTDSDAENVNLATSTQYAAQKAQLHAALLAGWQAALPHNETKWRTI